MIPTLRSATLFCVVALVLACARSGYIVDLGSDLRPGVQDSGGGVSGEPGGAEAGGTEAGGDVGKPLRCAVRPSACGYPDETNTGPSTGAPLAPSASISVKVNGTVVSGLDIRGGGVDIDADDVTVRNVRILLGGGADAGTFAIAVRPGHKNVLIEDCLIAGIDKTKTDDIQMAIFDMAEGGQVTIRRVNIFNCSQCITTVGATIEDSYIHDLSRPDSHAIYHTCDGSGPVVRHNTLFNPFETTSTVYLDPVGGQCGRVVLDDNLAAGGRHVFVLGLPPSHDLRITNNRFSRLYFPNGGSEAAEGGFDANGSANLWSGNYWDETGDVVLP